MHENQYKLFSNGFSIALLEKMQQRQFCIFDFPKINKTKNIFFLKYYIYSFNSKMYDSLYLDLQVELQVQLVVKKHFHVKFSTTFFQMLELFHDK